ncbi:MAG: imidazolonepropionase [Aestuariivirgaceae bacterium]
MSLLLRHGTLASMVQGAQPYGLVSDGAVLVTDGRIAWVGPSAEAPAADETVDLEERLVTPGLIDCHTHLVYGGSRSDEFEARLKGKSYAEIAKAGGGILSTVRATRAADEAALIAQSLPRLDALLADGVTTVEIKSGYGLDEATELKMLRAARALGEHRPVSIVTSYLGAHAIPPEYRENRQGYVRLVGAMMPKVKGLADAVDAFCETIAFSAAETETIFATAQTHGLPVKLHAEQLSNMGGAQIAARFGALSVDHLEYLDAEGIAAIAGSGTVATLLPGAFYYLNETRKPPVQALRAAQVPMAVASDLNPGSSPVHSLLTTMNMASVLFGLTPEESLAGATRVAAMALGLGDRGRIVPGLRADLAIWNTGAPVDLVYPVGLNRLQATLLAGQCVRGQLG